MVLASASGAAAAAPKVSADTLYRQVASAPDPSAAFAALSAQDRQSVIEYLTPVKTVVSTTTTDAPAGVTPMASTCKWASGWIRGLNAVGGTVWQWHQEVEFCYSGGKITSLPYIDQWGDGYMAGWGQNTTPPWPKITTAGGNGQASYTRKAQAWMQLCLPIVGCIQNQYPWVTLTMSGTGTWSGSFGA
jgi:hypothetical protein